MPVPASINDLSTTAGSNSPPGSESPAVLDDYQRAHASFIAQLRNVSGLGSVAGQFLAFSAANTASLRAIVGTVTDSGGVTTGAIFETGTGSSGSYVRFADGTQICFWRTSPVTCNGTSLMGTTNWFRTTQLVWTYPAAFFAGTVPTVLPGGERSGNTGVISGGLGSTPTNTSAEVFAISTLNDGTVRHVLFAIGRWK